MAVKKVQNSKFKIQTAEPSLEPVSEKKGFNERWVSVGWVLLLAGGLAQMLPEQMGPLLKYSAYGVSVQTAIGVLSVITALYFLLGE